ncbi:uncharacterized protein [Populus alba]|uniref:Rotamase n=1 Tax=Populus alba x Populus x berolinensis TaxID=444605 RepID=A0AAD6M0V7_9ROSI|nr:hypothetical protein NC653_028794 [Populus alba x Populus x berolinensis]
MISSRAFSLMRKPFFPTTCRSFGTFYGHENRNIIRSFTVAKPWRSNYMLQSMEIPNGGHRLSFFISYTISLTSDSDDDAYQDPNWKRKQTKRPAVPSPSKFFKTKKSRQTEAGSSDCCVKDGQKVKIHLKLYDIHTHELRCETNDPEIIGPRENDICEGLYEGIVGMRVGQIRRIVLPLSSDITGEHDKMMMKKKHFEEHGIYYVKLVEIIG